MPAVSYSKFLNVSLLNPPGALYAKAFMPRDSFCRDLMQHVAQHNKWVSLPSISYNPNKIAASALIYQPLVVVQCCKETWLQQPGNQTAI